MATILTKKKDTTGAPLAGDLTNSSGGAELAVNTADKRLYTKDSGGNVVEIGTNPTIIDVDNLRLDANSIISTNTNGNIAITPNGTGEVDISKVDIDSGAIDGTAIGANSASTGSFTTLTASGQTTVTGNSASTPAVSPVGDTNTGIFFPAADTIAFSEGGAEAMRITSAGRLGIGTTSAGAKLEVAGSINTGDSAIRITNNVVGTEYVDLQSGINGVSNAGFQLGVNGTARMVVDSSGNVGIGTSSPAVPLHVSTTGTSTSAGGNAAVTIRSQASGRSSTLQFSDGTVSTWVGQVGGSNLNFGTDGTERARITSGGYFKASNSGSYVDSAGTFHELLSDATSAITTCSIANTSASCTSDGIAQARAARNTTNNTFYAFSYYNSGAGAYKFRVADSGNVTNTNNSYGSISDVKLKQDIVDAGSQWNDIKNLRVRKYRWKSDPEGFLQMGLVAQEAEEVSPGLIEQHLDYEEVTKTREVEKTREVTPAVLDEDGNEIEPAVTETYTEEEEYTEREPTGTVTKAVKYSVLYMKAVKALQEAMERIETLEANNTALEARIAALEN